MDGDKATLIAKDAALGIPKGKSKHVTDEESEKFYDQVTKELRAKPKWAKYADLPSETAG